MSAAIRTRHHYAGILASHRRAGLPKGVFLSGFPIKILYEIRFPWQKNEFLVRFVGPGQTVVACNLEPHYSDTSANE